MSFRSRPRSRRQGFREAVVAGPRLAAAKPSALCIILISTSIRGMSLALMRIAPSLFVAGETALLSS